MRPWQIWSAFVACLLIVVGAVGWLSFRALEADNAEAAARQRATVEENSRLALWRMDSALAPLVAEESARPYYMYEPFYSVERVVGRALPGKADRAATLPSPLLSGLPPQVLLHFQVDSTRKFSSPQVLIGAQRQRAVPTYLSAADLKKAEARLEQVKKLVDPPKLLAMLPAGAPATVEPMVVADVANATSNSAANQTANPNFGQRGVNNDPLEPPLQVAQAPNSPPQSALAQSPYQSANEPADAQQQQARGNYEYQARSQILNNPGNRLLNNSANGYQNNQGSNYGNGNGAIGPPSGDVRIGAMTPIWLADQLILARRVTIDGHELIQGCLLDWPAIQQQLLASIRDLLPEAQLSAVALATPDEQAHMLASLPVRLDARSIVEATGEGLSAVRQSLIVTWLLMLLAAAAVASLLQGVMALSERRAAFVSAVTHELRTPLTTFRLYSEMLAEGMVTDESTRSRYLKTLQTEADRLTHLVENVLTYARVERGRPGRQIGPVSVAQLLDHAEERLAQRAQQANLQLLVEADDTVRESQAVADATAVEQILFNLVDNACKYAAVATDRTLHLAAERSGSRIFVRICDHGPGISPEQRRALFQPFRKSAQEAAHSAPGVGLGLALCRRLARDMGGDLQYAAEPDGGSCFTLELRSA
jgi:signal transduction histidine kinase